MENNFNTGVSKGRGRGASFHQDLTSELRQPHNITQSPPSPASGDRLESNVPRSSNNMASLPSYAAAVAGGAEHRQADAPAHNSWNNDPLSQNLTSSNCSNENPIQASPIMARNESNLPEPQRTNNSVLRYEITPAAVNVTPGVYTSSNFEKQKLSPFAKEFVPRSFTAVEETVPDYHVITTLENFITEVTCNPGKYDNCVKGICNFLKSNVKNNSTLNAVVNTVFSQAILEANFRYNAARLCNQLTTNCEFESLTINFVDAIVQRSLNDFDQRDFYLNSNPAMLRGFTLFLGELYSQIEINNERIGSLAKCIPKLLETLLNAPPSADNFKSVCQVLKFTGANLEDDEKRENSGTIPVMGKVIKQLEDSIENAPREVQNMMKSVVELQSKNWGRRASPSPPIVNNYAAALPSDPFNMVCYGPDGQPLTEEEQLFLESNQPDSDGDEDDDDSSDEMDEEIRAAFEDFLLTTGQEQ